MSLFAFQFSKMSLFFDIQHANGFLSTGRYNKYSRELPQTPWFVDGCRRFESSVQELICDPLNKEIDADGKAQVLKVIFFIRGHARNCHSAQRLTARCLLFLRLLWITLSDCQFASVG